MAPRIPSDSTVASTLDLDRMDLDDDDSSTSSRRSSITAASPHSTPPPPQHRTIPQLRSTLHSLRLRAQHSLSLQPQRTQLSLATTTRTIFTTYSQHGSQLRLSTALAQYLTSPHPTKNLTIWSPAEATRHATAASHRMASLRLLCAARALSHAQKAALSQNIDPTTLDPTLIRGADITNSPLDGRLTLSNDLDSVSLLRDEVPFRPTAVVVTYDAYLRLPPQILVGANKVLGLLNVHANAKLGWLVDKYITLSPTPSRTQQAYALLRLAVLEEFSALAAGLFNTETVNNDGFGMTQAQRGWVRECYERLSMGGEGMSVRERGLVADAVGLGEEVVEEWWEWRMGEVRGRKGARIWCKAREVEGLRRAKLEGRW